MRYKGLSTLEVLEGADNYNKWIAQVLMPYVKSPCLEIGAGIGNISHYFRRRKRYHITDVDSRLLTVLKNRFKNHANITISHLDITKTKKLKNRIYASVFAVNVFEHIKDDQKAFENVYSLLKKNGNLVLLVPAKKFAFTRLDKNLGHYRRYEKEELSNKLQKAGFSVEELYYFNIIGLLSWVVRDKIERQDVQLNKSQIALFDTIVPFLKIIESVLPIPVGISLIAVAKKK